MKRPHMPLSIKLSSALIALGFHPRAAAKAAGIELPPLPLPYSEDTKEVNEIEWHHQPSLGLRVVDGDDWLPKANDPRFIVPIAKAEHARQTNGDPAIPLSGDKSRISKTDRLQKDEAEFRARLEATFRECFDPPPRPKPKRRIPARKDSWPKGRKFQRRAI